MDSENIGDGFVQIYNICYAGCISHWNEIFLTNYTETTTYVPGHAMTDLNLYHLVILTYGVHTAIVLVEFACQTTSPEPYDFAILGCFSLEFHMVFSLVETLYTMETGN